MSQALEPVCETPCTIQVAAGTYNVRANLAGYRDEAREVRVGVKGADLEIPLELIRGNVLVEAPGATALQVNGTPIPAQQAEWSLIPGVYRIAADFGPTMREHTLNVKPGARLRLELHP